MAEAKTTGNNCGFVEHTCEIDRYSWLDDR